MAFSSPKLKPAAAEEESPPPLLSLSLPVPIPNPNSVLDVTSTSSSTISKSCKFWLNDCLLRHVFVSSAFIVGAIFTKKLYSWYMCLPQKNIVFEMFESIVNRLLTSRFLRVIRSKGTKENENENEKERRDSVVVPAELPLDMLGKIGRLLMSRVDILCFRSVCKRWRSSLPYPTRFPLRVPRPPGPSESDILPYFITEVSIYSVAVGSKEKSDVQQVLVEFEELDQGGNFLAEVFIPNEVKFNFPMVSTKRLHHEHQLSRLSFIAKAYQLRTAQLDKIVIISSESDHGVDARYAPASELSVVALLKTGKRLALLRLGGSKDANWDWDTSFCSRSFADIATYKGKLCAIDQLGRAYLMDYDSLKMTQVAAPVSIDSNIRGWKELVEVCGDLHMVVSSDQYEPIVVVVKVYKLSLRIRRWIEVDGIGDQVILRERSYTVSIPRSFLPKVYESWMMKCKGLRPYFAPPSMLFAHDHMKVEEDDYDDDTFLGAMGYCFLGFTKKRFVPWLPV